MGDTLLSFHSILGYVSDVMPENDYVLPFVVVTTIKVCLLLIEYLYCVDNISFSFDIKTIHVEDLMKEI